jgi:DNA polymerase-3 subunit beta
VINTKKFQGSNSIQFSDDEGILLAAATDGPRLLLIRDEDIPPFNLLLPKRLAKIITNLPKAITLESSATAVVISTEDVTVIGRLTATEFPDWKRVMPENYKLVVQVDTAEMLQALERVGIMASEELPGVVLEFVNNHMLTLVTGGGTAEESININTVTSSLDGNLPKIILHHRYLTDFFKNILKISKTARIFINNKNSPVAIKAGSAHLLICPRMTA